MKIKVLQNILDANDQIARRNQQLLDKNKVLAMNIIVLSGLLEFTNLELSFLLV